MSFPAHSSYRDSGVDWLDEVPADWSVQKFRFTFHESGEKIESEVVGPMLSVSGYRGIEVKEYDDENRRRADEDLIGYRIVRPGQLVVNTMWLNYAGLGVSAHEGHVSPAYRAYWFTDQSADPRFIHYLLRSSIYVLGYASGFAGLIEWIDSQLPRNEVIGQALRQAVPLFPELAVRELVANALIHQDFSIGGTGPMVEIFDGRSEITNPGSPLIDIQRLLDHAPRSRNEALARFMRRVGICEERGTGVDKVVWETEYHQLPPPVWEKQDAAFRVTLFAPKALREMDWLEKVHACYLHACLRYVNREPVTNTSLRERFRVTSSDTPRETHSASRMGRFA